MDLDLKNDILDFLKDVADNEALFDLIVAIMTGVIVELVQKYIGPVEID